jgi:hypothetical protein
LGQRRMPGEAEQAAGHQRKNPRAHDLHAAGPA